MLAGFLLRRMLLILAFGGCWVALTVLFSGAAHADENITPIGPGYSQNHTGVTCIQKFLGVRMQGAAYGTYGQATYSAVETFQADHDLPVDGAVGPTTATAMLEDGMSTSCRDVLPTVTTSSSTTSSGADPSSGRPATSSNSAAGAPGVSSPADTGSSSGEPSTSSSSAPPVSRGDLTGEDAHQTGCDADAYTVKTAPMVIEQQRRSATDTTVSGEVSTDSNAEGAGAAGIAGPAAGAAGKGSVKNKTTGTLGADRRTEYTTVESTIGAIEVRYSPTCHTAWTRVMPEDESALSGVAISNGAHRENRDIHPGLGRGRATKPGTYVSPMITVGASSRVIGSLDDNAGGGAKLAADGTPSTGGVVPASASPLN